MQSRKAAAAHLKSEQLLPFGFAERCLSLSFRFLGSRVDSARSVSMGITRDYSPVLGHSCPRIRHLPANDPCWCQPLQIACVIPIISRKYALLDYFLVRAYSRICKGQTAVTANLKSKQLLYFGFAREVVSSTGQGTGWWRATRKIMIIHLNRGSTDSTRGNGRWLIENHIDRKSPPYDSFCSQTFQDGVADKIPVLNEWKRFHYINISLDMFE